MRSRECDGRAGVASALFLSLVALACASAPGGRIGAREVTEGERLFEEAMVAAEANDAPRAFELMQQAADLGEPEAIAALASFIDTGFGTSADPERALDLFEEALKRGSIAAKLNVGLKLIWSNSEADQMRAIELLESLYASPPDGGGRESIKGAAAGGLGAAYLFGRGVAKDLERGVGLLEESDEAGTASPQVHYLLGQACESGWGGRKVDPKRSYQHFLEAAEGGVPGAQWKAGMALLEGRGTDRDEKAAYGWVRRAAEAGDPRAEISLAVMLALGQGVTENDPEARDWYGRGVARNLAHAIRGLGFMLFTGEGGTVDRATGWAYLTLAADAGDEAARRAVEELAGEVSAADRRVSEAIAADWIEMHGAPKLMEE